MLQEALSAYQRAVDLAPSRLIHRVELARTALRLGQVTRAARELQVNRELHEFCCCSPPQPASVHIVALDRLAACQLEHNVLPTLTLLGPGM